MSYTSSNTFQENALLYKSKPTTTNKLRKNNGFSSLMRYSSSSRDLSIKGSYGDDIEKISNEMRIVNREIKIKSKEYEIIK